MKIKLSFILVLATFAAVDLFQVSFVNAQENWEFNGSETALKNAQIVIVGDYANRRISPQLTETSIYGDISEIRSMVPSISEKLSAKSMIDNRDIYEMIRTVWIEMRTGKHRIPFNEPLDKEEFMASVFSRGKLTVTSAPEGARIFINGDLQSPDTNATFWLKEGTYQIDYGVLNNTIIKVGKKVKIIAYKKTKIHFENTKS